MQEYTNNLVVQASVNVAVIVGILTLLGYLLMGFARPTEGPLRHPIFGNATMHVPNFMSLLRFPLALWILVIHVLPEFSSPIWFGTMHLAFWICVLFDILDGKFARKWRAITEDGKSLDPAADKFVTFCLAMCAYLFGAGSFPWWALTIVFTREVASVVKRHYMRRRGRDVSAGWLGKVKTGVQFTVLYILILRIDDIPGSMGLELPIRALPDGFVLWGVVLLCFITVISLFPFFEAFEYVNRYRKPNRAECSQPWYLVWIPNAFTIGNYLCGVTAVYFAMPEVKVLYRPFVILFWVMMGGLLDAMDGPMARRLKVHSEFGGCLDSSTDLSTFGLAVATIIYLVFRGIEPVPMIWAVLLAGFYFWMVHLRLARFTELTDEQEDHSKKEDFVGLPSPTGALTVLVLLTLFHDLQRMSATEIAILTLLIVGTSLLMYSRYSYVSHANAWRYPLYRYVLIPTILLGFAFLTVLNFQQPFVTNHFSRELIFYFRGCSWILTTALAIYIIDGIRRGKTLA